jgi:hypothetical protein
MMHKQVVGTVKSSIGNVGRAELPEESCVTTAQQFTCSQALFHLRQTYVLLSDLKARTDLILGGSSLVFNSRPI